MPRVSAQKSLYVNAGDTLLLGLKAPLKIVFAPFEKHPLRFVLHLRGGTYEVEAVKWIENQNNEPASLFGLNNAFRQSVGPSGRHDVSFYTY